MGQINTPYSNLPIPDVDAARDVPYWLGLLGKSLDLKLPLYAASTVERDSKYAATPIGTLCIDTTTGIVYIKVSDASTLPPVWGVVYQPSTAVTWYPIVMNSGFGPGGWSTPPAAAQIGNFVYLRGSFGLSNGQALASGLGTINAFGTLPGNVQIPQASSSFAVACGYWSNDPVGRVFIHSADGAMEFSVNSTTYWASLDGIFYYTG